MDARRTDVLKASPRMFESDLLDRLSRVHPLVPVAIFVPAITLLFVAGARGEPTTLEVIALVVGGYVFWTLTEYWMHSLLCHLYPELGIQPCFHSFNHGGHLDQLKVHLRLLVQLSVSFP